MQTPESNLACTRSSVSGAAGSPRPRGIAQRGRAPPKGMQAQQQEATLGEDALFIY